MIPNKGKTGFLPSSESGYTILEGLMAVVVVAVLVSAMGPVIAFSVGTRVQAKRVELATQAGRSYIDGVKSGAVEIKNLPFKTTESAWLQASPPANSSLKCPTTPNLDKTLISCETPSEVYCINFDGEDGCQTNSMTDMVVQGIVYDQTSGSNITNTKSYELAVRVYRANSFGTGSPLKSPGQNGLKSDSLTTNALGDRSLPLVVMKTEVFPQDATYDNLKERVNGGSSSAPTP